VQYIHFHSPKFFCIINHEHEDLELDGRERSGNYKRDRGRSPLRYGKQSYCKLESRVRFTCSLPLRNNTPEQRQRSTLVLRTANLRFCADPLFAIYSFSAATVQCVVTLNTISPSYVSGLPTLTSYCWVQNPLTSTCRFSKLF
jgi:hypothetical protein